MALADAILSRWNGLSARLRLILYSILLGQGRRADLVRFVSAQRLAEDWPALAGLLGERMRRACERRFGLLYARLDPCVNT